MTRIAFLNKMLVQYRSLSERDRKILLIGIFAAAFIISYKYAFIPLMNWREGIVNELEQQHMIFEKMSRTITNAAKIEEDINRLQSSRIKTEQSLIKADNVELASADLIKEIRALASAAGIQTSRISTSRGKADELTLFQEITVSIPSMRCDMKQLNEFMVNIKKSSLLLTMKELRIRVTNMKDPSEVSVNMDITAYMLKEAGTTSSSPETVETVETVE